MVVGKCAVCGCVRRCDECVCVCVGVWVCEEV